MVDSKVNCKFDPGVKGLKSDCLYSHLGRWEYLGRRILGEWVTKGKKASFPKLFQLSIKYSLADTLNASHSFSLCWSKQLHDLQLLMRCTCIKCCSAHTRSAIIFSSEIQCKVIMSLDLFSLPCSWWESKVQSGTWIWGTVYLSWCDVYWIISC